MMNFQELIDHLAPDPAAARAAAEAPWRTHPSKSSAELIARASHWAKLRAATAGAATGVVSNPLTMIPAALADMAAVLKIDAAPLVGIGIGSGWNWLEAAAIGQRAVKYYDTRRLVRWSGRLDFHEFARRRLKWCGSCPQVSLID